MIPCGCFSPSTRNRAHTHQSRFRCDRLDVPLSVAPHDIDGLLSAVTSGNLYGLRGAARHIGPIRRRDSRRISMGPIPGNIVCIDVMHIAGCRLRTIRDGFAIRWPVEALVARPEEAPYVVSPVMPKRVGDRRPGNRMRRSKPSAMRRSRPRECLVRGKHKRYCAERRDQRPIHSIRHGTHQYVGYWATRQHTLGRAFRARKCTVNYWLKRNINRHRFPSIGLNARAEEV